MRIQLTTKMNYCWLLVLLFALLSAGNSLADILDADASHGDAKISALPAMMVDEPEDVMDAGESESKIEESNDMQFPLAKDEVLEAIKDLSDKDAQLMKQPGMQRLARELNNFHGRQQHYRVRQVAAYVPSEVNNDNEDDAQEAVAEERAIRRRKRVRRRNSNNQVRRTQQNKQSANRRNTSRRPSTGNRNLVKRKNAQNSNRYNNRRPSKRRNSNSNNNNGNKNGVSKSGKRQTNNRNQGIRNSNRKASTRKNNKNRKNKSKKQRKRVKKIEDDDNMVREDQHQEPMPDAAQAA